LNNCHIIAQSGKPSKDGAGERRIEKQKCRRQQDEAKRR
jgi:hypothetical protein